MRTLMDRATVLTATLAFLALAAAAPVAAQQKEPDAVVPLSQGDGSRVHGEALILDADETGDMDAHRVELRLDGLDSDASYAVHLHRAPCADGGAALLGQKGVQEDDPGRDAGTTTASEKSEKKDDEKARTGKTTKSSDDAGTEHPPAVVRARLPGGTPAACGDVSTEKTQRKGQDASY